MVSNTPQEIVRVFADAPAKSQLQAVDKLLNPIDIVVPQVDLRLWLRTGGGGQRPHGGRERNRRKTRFRQTLVKTLGLFAHQ